MLLLVHEQSLGYEKNRSENIINTIKGCQINNFRPKGYSPPNPIDAPCTDSWTQLPGGMCYRLVGWAHFLVRLIFRRIFSHISSSNWGSLFSTCSEPQQSKRIYEIIVENYEFSTQYNIPILVSTSMMPKWVAGVWEAIYRRSGVKMYAKFCIFEIKNPLNNFTQSNILSMRDCTDCDGYLSRAIGQKSKLTTI